MSHIHTGDYFDPDYQDYVITRWEDREAGYDPDLDTAPASVCYCGHDLYSHAVDEGPGMQYCSMCRECQSFVEVMK